MIEAYKKYLSNYANFNGCSSVSDYWWVVLCNFLIALVINIIKSATGVNEIIYVSYVYDIAVLVPSIALMVRRLHDTNKSGWYCLISLIPLVGPFILIAFTLMGRKEPNNYGERI